MAPFGNQSGDTSARDRANSGRSHTKAQTVLSHVRKAPTFRPQARLLPQFGRRFGLRKAAPFFDLLQPSFSGRLCVPTTARWLFLEAAQNLCGHYPGVFRACGNLAPIDPSWFRLSTLRATTGPDRQWLFFVLRGATRFPIRSHLGRLRWFPEQPARVPSCT